MDDTKSVSSILSNQSNPVIFHEPSVHLIAETKINNEQLAKWLEERGFVFQTDAPSYPDALAENGGRLCYLSYNADRRRHTGVGQNERYLQRTVREMGHGSITEHASFTFLVDHVSRNLTHELVRHRVGTAFCLAGDTEIWSGAKINGKWDGVRKKRTIKELWEWTQDKRASRIGLTTVRCWDGEEFVPAYIRSVFRSGIKRVFKVVTENGYSIRCTLEHRFLTPEGWKPLSDIGVGGLLLTSGKKATEYGRAKLSLTRREKYGLNAQKSPAQSHDEARRIMGIACRDCGTGNDLTVHHKDRNPFNNDKSNLEILCNSCHKYRHLLEDGPPLLTAEPTKVISIIDDGLEMTYDLEVLHPEHNFVANGIITHNSQASTRYIDHLESYLGWYIPPEIAAIPDLFARWLDNVASVAKLYQDSFDRLSALGMEKKRARSIARHALLGSAGTAIQFTVNVRELNHIFGLRGAAGADDEFTRLSIKMWEKVKWMNLFKHWKLVDVDGKQCLTQGD